MNRETEVAVAFAWWVVINKWKKYPGMDRQYFRYYLWINDKYGRSPGSPPLITTEVWKLFLDSDEYQSLPKEEVDKHYFSPSEDDSNFCSKCGEYFTAKCHKRTINQEEK